MISQNGRQNVRNTLNKPQFLLYCWYLKSTTVQRPHKTPQLPIQSYLVGDIVSHHWYFRILSCNYQVRICVLTISPSHRCIDVKLLHNHHIYSIIDIYVFSLLVVLNKYIAIENCYYIDWCVVGVFEIAQCLHCAYMMLRTWCVGRDKIPFF